MNRRLLAAAILASGLVACSQKDTEAPPAPNVDPIESPTPQEKIWVTGSAEYGSTITISGAQAVDPATVTADSFTARFRAKVTLAKDQTNNLSITATDKAGNKSDATTVDVIHASSQATSLVVTLGSYEVRAGDPVDITVKAVDQYGNAMANPTVAFSSTPALAANVTPPCGTVSLTQGFIGSSFRAYDLSLVKDSSYTFTLTAKSGTVSKDVKLVVRPGPARRFAPGTGCTGEQLAFTDATWATDLTGPVSVTAGQNLYYRYSVIDAYGNPTVGPVSAFSTAPSAQIIDDGMSGKGQVANLTVAGSSYKLNAFINGVSAPAQLSFAVGVAAPANVSVMLSSTLAALQSKVTAIATVRDQFGNIIACDSTSLANMSFAALPTQPGTTLGSKYCTGSAPNQIYAQDFTFSTADTYSIVATYDAGAGATAVGSGYITVLGLDVTPPTVSITTLVNNTVTPTVLVNGVPCVLSGNLCVVRPGDQIGFTVTASDNVALSEISYSAFFATAGGAQSQTILIPAGVTSCPSTNCNSFFSFGIPGGVILEDVPLVAQAVDSSGNRASSPPLILRVTFQLFGGRSARLIATGATVGGMINAPEDVVLNTAGDLFIGNAGNNNLLKLPAQGGQVAPQGSFPSIYASGFSSGFLTIDDQGNLYSTANGGGGGGAGRPDVMQISAAAGNAVTRYIAYASGARLRGLDMELATAAKGLITAGTGVATPIDGDTVTVGTGANARTYEANDPALTPPANACPNTAGSTNVCFDLTAAGVISDLVNAINTKPTPHGDVTASYDTATKTAVLIARTAGAAGNSVAMSTLVGNRFILNGTPVIGPKNATLSHGRDPSMFVGQESRFGGGGGATQNTIFRFPFNLAALPGSEANAIDSYNVGLWQWGVAARDLTTASSVNLSEYVHYFVDGTNQANLVGWHYLDNGAVATNTVFTVNGVGNGGRNFNQLWDLVVEPGGCVLATDAGRGRIYAVNTKNAAKVATNADVTLVADGLNAPMGVAMHGGKLYVADQGANAIIEISSSGGTASCF